MNKHTLLITIILALVLASGCNTENDGIFMRISKSETKTDVGTITLIAKSGSKFYAKTREHQLQVYESNPATKGWTLLSTQATYVATDAPIIPTNIYFAPLGTGDVNNPISKYPLSGGAISDVSNLYNVVAMSPTANVMVVKDGSGKFDVLKASDASIVNIGLIDLTFYETFTPQLIVQNDTNFIVSGVNGKPGDTYTYTHYLYDGAFHTISGVNSPVIAFYNDTTNIVLLTSSGEIWHNGGSGYAFTKKGTAPNFSAGTPSHMPYPVFFHGGKLYLQDKNNYMHSITLATGTVAEEKTIDLSAVKARSYLVDPLNSDIIYVGTTQNGIFEIDMAATPKTVKSL